MSLADAPLVLLLLVETVVVRRVPPPRSRREDRARPAERVTYTSASSVHVGVQTVCVASS